jgi:hypothetical protein
MVGVHPAYLKSSVHSVVDRGKKLMAGLRIIQFTSSLEKTEDMDSRNSHLY